MSGWLLFISISLFCFLFIIAFCEVAHESTQLQWLLSTGLSLLLDMVVFEIAIPVIVGCLGALSFGCGLKCILLWIIVLIEALRSIRSFMGIS